MEEETSLALVTANNHVVIPSHRHSFPSLPIANGSYSLTFKEPYTVEEFDTPENQTPLAPTPQNHEKKIPRFTLETLSVILSVLYCKFLIILGLALPITKIISTKIPTLLYDFFYIYLYGGSLAFIIVHRVLSIKKKTLRRFGRTPSDTQPKEKDKLKVLNHYGSFYLQLGASAFGIGSMVYSGLEFGEHFLLSGSTCYNIAISALKPALRMIFTLLQIQFIFLNESSIQKKRFSSLMRFSLAHMFATNIAEWLSVVVEETKHEIHSLHSHEHGHNNQTANCTDTTSGVLVSGATSYLFPCSIEYSLICAVTLIEMWKDVPIKKKVERETLQFKETAKKENKQYSVDCTHSENGLIGGLLSNVYTLISLLVFFALRTSLPDTAYWCLTICDTVLNASSLLAITMAAIDMRNLPYCVHRFNDKGALKLGLDISLLLKAQFGVYLYSVFSAIACYFTPNASLWPDMFSIIQTSIQTIFILDAWWKRCASPSEQEKKPGRQSLTFLRLVNVAMWIITITERSRAQLRPLQLAFYGAWPWTIITHVSMPLVVFYRFHSTICFFEVWRNSYKGIHTVPNTELMF